MNKIASLLPFILLAGCGSGGSGEEGGKADPVALVRTTVAQAGATSDQMVVYGATEPGPGDVHSVIVPAEAIVDRILAPNGTSVKAGQAILSLRPSRTTAIDLVKATADAATAEAAYQRSLRLRGNGLVSDADVEMARAAAQAARATRANLGMARGGVTLRAPADGVVQGLAAKVGDQIAAGATVASVAARGDLRAHLGIDPAVALRLHPGQSLSLDTVSGSAHVVVPITGVDTQVDPTTRLASIYAMLPDDFGVGPGEALHASLTLAAQPNGITIPYSALLDDGGRSYVYVVRGGIAHEQSVLPGNSSGDRIQILKGLAAGDRVVTEGGTALEDGMKVRVEETPQ